MSKPYLKLLWAVLFIGMSMSYTAHAGRRNVVQFCWDYLRGYSVVLLGERGSEKTVKIDLRADELGIEKLKAFYLKRVQDPTALPAVKIIPDRKKLTSFEKKELKSGFEYWWLPGNIWARVIMDTFDIDPRDATQILRDLGTTVTPAHAWAEARKKAEEKKQREEEARKRRSGGGGDGYYYDSDGGDGGGGGD